MSKQKKDLDYYKGLWEEFYRIMSGMWDSKHPWQSVFRMLIAMATATLMSVAACGQLQ